MTGHRRCKQGLEGHVHMPMVRCRQYRPCQVEMPISLSCVDACRHDKIDEAANFAATNMSMLTGLLRHRSPAYDAVLQDVVALIAYMHPEVSLGACSLVTQVV